MSTSEFLSRTAFDDIIASLETLLSQVQTARNELDGVVDNLSDLLALEANLTELIAVFNALAEINAVAGNESNINAVAGNESNINAVANINAEINTLAASIAELLNLEGNLGAVTAVDANETNINTVADNIGAIQDAASALFNFASAQTATPIGSGDTDTWDMGDEYAGIVLFRNGSFVRPADYVLDDNEIQLDYEVGDDEQLVFLPAKVESDNENIVQDLGQIDGSVTINLTLGTIVKAELTDTVTLSFSPLPGEDREAGFVLRFEGIEEINFPAGTKFANGIEPSPKGDLYEIPCSINESGDVIVYGVINNIE